ncbi:MAG: sensor histidine kinase [Actinomycetota bacterium]
MSHLSELSHDELEASFEETLAALPETILHIDGELAVVRVNRPESPVFKTKPQPGDRLGDLLDPTAGQLIFDVIKNAEVTGGAIAEVRSGADLYRVSARPLTTAPLTLLLFKNITGIRNAGQAIVDLVRDRSSFLTAISQELRTPLSAVVGYANLLADSSSALDEDDRQDLVRDMTDQAWELAGIVEDLLTVAHAELGELNLAKVPVNVGANVAQVIESMGSRASSIRVVEDQTITGIGDPAKFRQVVRNLLSNALRHGSGPISAEIWAEDDMAVLTVKDHGDGIAADLAELIEKKADDAASSSTPGSLGLGLWTSQELTRVMSGTLSYERTEGVTVFEARIPLL